ncbi:MAG: carboxypeptidase regulatory-like domain-containing protein [Planctomycetes bacterium]|nr:carboxypeptidase regulatory-like domain-containing protein [Planctomycetota bacterium]
MSPRPFARVRAVLVTGTCALVVTTSARAPAAEVFEVGAKLTDCLPKGKEADGIIGDFVLRNGHLEALVSGALPERKANMGTNWNQPTPGCLYDLCVRGSENDQLTYLGPGGLEGPVSHVRAIGPEENPLGAQGVRTERTAATGQGHGQRHDYLLKDDWAFIAILSTYRNEDEKEWEVSPDPSWKELTARETVSGVLTGDATNPSHRQGYAAYVCEWKGKLDLGPRAEKLKLKKGEERSFLTVVAPGISPAAAFSVVARLRGGSGALRGRVREGDQPVTTATLEVRVEEPGADKKPATKVLRAYADAQGRLDLALPPGKHTLKLKDLGRPEVSREVEVRSGGEVDADFDLPRASKVSFVATSEGKPVPCKVQFVGLGETKSPYFGVDIQARGCRNIYMAETGSFTQQVDPGRYRLIATHGIEYDHAVRDVELKAGEAARVEVALRRIVDTRGWVSTDFHNHSTPSGDNYCGTDDRVIILAVEQVEFAPTTEHNRLYDWGPHIERLGLKEELRTVPGIELTGPNAHFNSFPFKPVPFTQDGGAPRWQHDPRLNAIVLRDYQEGGPFRWVHLNHPQVGKFFRDRNADGVADGGYAGLDLLIDAAEVWSLYILDPNPKIRTVANGKETFYENRTFAWLQLLNQGVRMNVIAVSDAHYVFGNACGGWRTYVRSSEDRPDKLDVEEVIRSSKAGRMFVTTGPFLEARLDDGTEPGGSTVARGPFKLHIKVQCTDWIDIDRVQVLVNGRQDPALGFTRVSHPDLFSDGTVKFEHKAPVALEEDAHLIVVAVGERFNLRTGYGKSTQAWWNPCAFTNPIYVDTDGHGFTPNGDTLGHPLPLGK